MGQLAIDMVDIDKRFGAVLALDGIRLGIGPGITGLLGPNGAGKTTMMRLLATVLAPDRGTLRLLDRDPGRDGDRVEIRRRLGYLPQEPGFYQRFSAFAFVDYVAILKEMSRERARHQEVQRVLDVVGLGEHASRRIKDLSGGMRRRLALAQALLGDPELLLLDEPTTGLDPEQRLKFRSLISQLPNRPTVLLSTHQTEDVTALCERVIVLAEAAVRFDGSPRDLAETARGRVWIGDEQAEGSRLTWRSGDGAYRHIGDPPPGAAVVDPTIDDAYLLTVGRGDMKQGAVA